MKDKKDTTEDLGQWESWAQQTYRTGATHPPKSRGGLIAFLLVLVIFLGGISSALGLMNIRLFRRLNALEATEPCSVMFSQSSAPIEATPGEVFSLGFSGQTVSPFWQRCHGLPQGIYVIKVDADSPADLQGLLAGDVLTAVDGHTLTDTAVLEGLLSASPPGTDLQVSLSRGGVEHSLTLTIGE